MIIKCAGVILDKGKLLVVRKKGSDVFLSPGGKVEPGEPLQDCVVRELKEEIDVDVKDLRFMGSYSSRSAIENRGIILHAWFVKYSGVATASSEIEEIRWIGLADVEAGMKVGSIFLNHIIPSLKAEGLIEK
ncbi:NUDIX hydrolase [Halomonas koreensis]|uniref:NUDIX domain-containing protein n=1 Tax=Halomonas koreensis TaxID=245385 RepID=A0ABU1FZU0_9GAMM|nr:NUDIX domain-containing protein [Halomonas koreensis]MDR5866190.1 NUDIX domain-containing protein [Halomonas koreensis]